MSAYMCESEKIMALALALHREGLPIAEASNAFTLFDRLRAKNMAATDTRYPGTWNPTEEAIYPDDLASVMRAADAYPVPLVDGREGSRGLIGEYVYQASECEDWEGCPESLALDALRVRLVAREEAERPAREAAEREQRAKAMEEARARLLATFPTLETAGTTDRSGCVLAAANLRTQLKAAFPGVKFRVTSSRYSGGSSVNVRWIDGPLAKDVEAIADCYQEGSFDGMDDSYHYATGEASLWCELFGGARFVSCDREHSDQAIAASLAEVVATYGAPEGQAPTVEDWKQGRLYRATPASHCDDLQTLVRKSLHARAWGSR